MRGYVSRLETRVATSARAEPLPAPFVLRELPQSAYYISSTKHKF